MKLTKFFLTAGVVSLSIAALAVSQAADKQRVFALVPKTISVPFYNDVERGMTDEAKKLGVVGKFIGPTTADAALQVQVLQDLVSQGVDGIAVAPMDADSVIGVISQARKKGIPVITFDSDSPKADRIAFVGTNNLGGGQEGGKAFKNLLPKGKFAIITGGLAAAKLNDRIKGFR
jgi:ribose transport system substrate-binding protein